jgi:hypothetical protein
MSTRVLDTLRKIFRVTLPAVSELAGYLKKPLPANMKIPILQHEFNNLVFNDPKNPCM